MKGPSEKYLCSLEIELGSPSLSHLPTAPQGEGAFLGVNEKNSFKYLFSARLHLREPMVRTSSAYQPSTCMFLGPERKGIPSHPTVPPHNPSPHPTPPLPESLFERLKGWGRNLPGHKFLAVFPQARWSSDEFTPMPSLAAFLPLQPSVPCNSKDSIKAALARSTGTYSLST